MENDFWNEFKNYLSCDFFIHKKELNIESN